MSESHSAEPPPPPPNQAPAYTGGYPPPSAPSPGQPVPPPPGAYPPPVAYYVQPPPQVVVVKRKGFGAGTWILLIAGLAAVVALVFALSGGIGSTRYDVGDCVTIGEKMIRVNALGHQTLVGYIAGEVDCGAPGSREITRVIPRAGYFSSKGCGLYAIPYPESSVVDVEYNGPWYCVATG